MYSIHKITRPCVNTFKHVPIPWNTFWKCWFRLKVLEVHTSEIHLRRLYT